MSTPCWSPARCGNGAASSSASTSPGCAPNSRPAATISSRRRSIARRPLPRTRRRKDPMAARLPLSRPRSSAATPSPNGCIDREKLAGRFPPRTRASELWRVAREYLDEAQDDATRARDPRSRSAPGSTSSPTARCGARATRTASPPRWTASTSTTPAPRSTAPATRTRCRASSAKISRKHAVEVARRAVPAGQHRPHDQDHRARALHDVPAGAERLLRRARQELAVAYAAAVNEEIKDLFAAGADIVQLDEPYMQARPEKARQYGLEGARPGARRRHGRRRRCTSASAMRRSSTSGPSGYNFLPELAERALKQISIETAQSNLDSSVLEKLRARRSSSACSTCRPRGRDAGDRRRPHPPRAAARRRRTRSSIAPDCGLKYLPREVAFGKMKAMADGAAIVRAEHKARA